MGTGINSAPGFAEAATAELAALTGVPFESAPNKFAVQGAHDALVHLSGTLRTLAVSLYKQAVLDGLGRSEAERIAIERAAYERCVDSGEAAIGRANFEQIVAGGTPAWGRARS